MADESRNNLPNGPYKGRWTDLGRPYMPQENRMDLVLECSPQGALSGCGSDGVGRFTISGSFDPQTERCSFLKKYGSHVVQYEGIQDGKRILGRWSLWDYGSVTGGFILWSAGIEAHESTRLGEAETLEEAVGDLKPEKRLVYT